MPVVGALLLSAVDRDLGAVHVQHYPVGRIDDLRLGDQIAADQRQAGKVFLLRQQFGLERLQARGQRRSALQDLLGADEAEGRVLGEALGVVDILIAGQSAVYRLPYKVGQWQLGVLPSRVRPGAVR